MGRPDIINGIKWMGRFPSQIIQSIVRSFAIKQFVVYSF
jgi:hypothetical protein